MPRVSELIVLAAPSCCGKSRFLDRALKGRHDDLLGLMDISAPVRSHRILMARELPKYRNACIPRMILHYAMPVPRSAQERGDRIWHDAKLDFVGACDTVTAVTLLASSDALRVRLRRRYRSKLKLLVRDVPRYLRERKRLATLKTAYEDPANLADAYEAWFRYLASLPNLTHSWLLTAERGYALRETADWPEIRDAFFRSAPELPLRVVAAASAD